MNIFDNLSPISLINSIPCFKSQNPNLFGLSDEFLKNKLLLSEENNNIIKLSRGEGRPSILNLIIREPNIIFDWGIKSMHSFLDSLNIRDFLEPNVVNKDWIFKILDLYGDELKYHYNRYLRKRSRAKETEIINIIKEAVTKSTSYSDLLIIKEWLCFALHTSGSRIFSKVSPWVSTSMKNDRYKISYLYGTGNVKNLNLNCNNGNVHKKFIILDYWVPISEENETYRNADYVGNKLRSMGIEWHPNQHNEVMVKYVLFPHQLIGYYYFENDDLKYYFINHHYLEAWKRDNNFNIGDYLYINQQHVDFPSKNPYKMIYSLNSSGFTVFNKRQ